MIDYFERRAPSYRAKSNRGLWGVFRARELAVVEELLALRDGETLLDLGCGAGHYSLAFKKNLALAVDSSPAMLREASALGLPTWLGRAEDIPETRRFDKILAAGMLEFVPNPEPVFAKCARLLEPDGKLVLLIPTDGWPGFFYRTAHEIRGCSAFIRSLAEYSRLAATSGFELHRHVPCTPLSTGVELRRRK